MTISVDVSPGMLAIEKIDPGLPPIPGKWLYILRDYYYERDGKILSLYKNTDKYFSVTMYIPNGIRTIQ